VAFNLNQGGNFISFATYSELTTRDQRILEANEGLTQAEVETYLTQASQRMLTQIRNTDWWSESSFTIDTSLTRDMRLLPSVNVYYIRAREQEFKDLNIYFALAEYIYPSVADFGNPESAEVAKINFFRDQYNKLFTELIQSGDWYDFDNDAAIETLEKFPNKQNRVRVR
jgi:hypothetical protein